MALQFLIKIFDVMQVFCLRKIETWSLFYIMIMTHGVTIFAKTMGETVLGDKCFLLLSYTSLQEVHDLLGRNFYHRHGSCLS